MIKFFLFLMLIVKCFANTEQLNYTEQQAMIKFMNEEIAKKNFSMIYELGLVYEDGILDINNKKHSDMKKATKYFIEAYDKGDYRSIFKLVPLLIKENELNEAISIVQKGIDFSSEKRSLLISLVSLYATLTIDYFGGDNEKFMDALYNISFVTNEELNKTPTLKFIKANIMNIVGDKEEAEKMLNEACFSKNAPDDLKKICFDTNNFLIAKEDVEKSIDDCSSCTLVKE